MICPWAMQAWIYGTAGSFRSLFLLILTLFFIFFGKPALTLKNKVSLSCFDCLYKDYTSELPSRKLVLAAVRKVLGKKEFDRRRIIRLVTGIYIDAGFPDCRVIVKAFEGTNRIQVSPGAFRSLMSVSVPGLSEKVIKAFFSEQDFRQYKQKVNSQKIDSILYGQGTFNKVPEYLWRPFNQGEIRKLKKFLIETLKSKGFIHAKILSTDLREEANGDVVNIALRINVFKGEKSLIRKISLDYRELMPRGLISSVESNIGKPVNPKKLSLYLASIESHLLNSGFLKARTDAVVREMLNHAGVSINFAIKLGKKYHYDGLEIEGDKITDSRVIAEELGLQLGSPLSANQLNLERANLLSLDMFEKVDFKAGVGDKLKLQLLEKSRVRLELGVGASFDQGPRGTLKFRFRNILGLGIFFSNHIQLNYPALFYSVPFVYTGEASRSLLNRFDKYPKGIRSFLFFEGKMISSLNYPKVYFLNKNLGLFLDAIVRRQIRVAFTLNQFSLEARGISKIGKALKFGPKIESAYSFFDCGTRRDVLTGQCGTENQNSVLRRESGTVKEINLAMFFEFLIKKRWSAKIEVTFGFGEADLDLGVKEIGHFKIDGKFMLQTNLTPDIEHSLNMHLGAILNVDPEGYVPMFRRYYLGGGKSLRGFPQDQILPADDMGWPAQAYLPQKNLKYRPFSFGGNFLVVFQNEVRFPISEKLVGAVFFDSGQLLENILNFSPLNFALGTGVGLRYQTAFGELQVDLAIRLMDGNREIFADFGEAFGLYFAINPSS